MASHVGIERNEERTWRLLGGPLLPFLVNLFSFCSLGWCSPISIEGPTFVREPSQHVDFSNTTGASVHCLARGEPMPIITWTLDKGAAAGNVVGLREIHSNGTIVFPGFRPEDYRQDIHATVYRCTATNAVGAIISNNVHVRAVVNQFYEVHVYDEYVIKGNTAVLKCHIPSFVRDYVTVTSWVRESSGSMQTVIRTSGRYSVYSSGELHIREVKDDDGRPVSYRCQTQHQLTGEIKLSTTVARLSVSDPQSSIPPRFTHNKSSLSANEGDTIDLPCAAQGYPIPSYRWQRLEGKRLVPVVLGSRIQQISGTLIIHNVKVDNAGIYVCLVNNTVGEEKTEVEVRVEAPLFAYIEPQKQVVDVGKPSSIRCSFTGFPITEVRWFKDARPLPTSHRIKLLSRDLLHITDVQREDRGMYQCFLFNSQQNMVQATVELQLGDAKPQLQSIFENSILDPNTPFGLKCIASGNPPPQFRWTLDDNPILSTDRFILHEQISLQGDVISHINVTKARPEDTGEYRCTATNRVGRVEHSAKLYVYGPPYVRSMGNVSAISGSEWNIQCRVAGYPISSIVWERDGIPLPINHRQKVYPNGTLVVHNIQRNSDAGSYTCVARDDINREAKATVYVNVLNPPKISPFAFPKDIQEGMRGTITCSVIHGDTPITVSWLKDGEPVRSQTDGITIMSVEDLTSMLILQHISPNDNGNYTCVAKNSAAAVNHTAKLLVLVPPNWLYEPRDASVVSRNSVRLDCQASGHPTPSVIWEKAIGRLPGDYDPVEYSGGRNHIFNNGSLLLTSVTEEDQGHYLCQANNSVGAGLSKVIFLEVYVPAHFEVNVRNQTVLKGHEAILRCEVLGDLPVTVIWQRQSQRFELRKKARYSIREEATSKGYVSELVVSKTTRDDSSEFSCLASNAYGKDETWIHLIVQEPPEAPIGAKVTSHESRIIEVSWEPPFDGNSNILQYIIQTKAVDGAWLHDKKNTTVPGNSGTWSLVTGLKPDIEYEVSVAAENSVGVGKMTTGVRIRTAEEAPEGAPTNITVESLSSQSLRISWKPPRSEHWNGDIMGYQIGFRLFESTEPHSFKSIDAKIDRRGQFIMDGLRKYTKYAIILQAYNRVGPGPRTREIIASTMEDVPSQPPKNVKCVASSSQSIRMEWLSPPSSTINGILRGYRILYKSIQEVYDKTNVEFLASPTEDVILEGLQKFTNYSLQVLAFTSAGDGAKTLPIFCRTKEDVPGAPSDIKVLPMSSDAIIVSWTPPKYPNGIITKYTVYMKVLDQFPKVPVESASSFTLPPNQFYYEVRGLNENHQYEFWVKAATVIGEGDKTAAISNSPVSTVPARIASFPQKIMARRKDDVKIACKSVGIPTPDRQWYIRGKHFEENNRMHILSDGTLLITGFRSTDSGNYTCRIHNIYTTDEITHEVLNQPHEGSEYPPSPPVLIVEEKTSTTLKFSWEIEEGSEIPLTGLSINYKKDIGDWEEVHLDSNTQRYSLEGLPCGTRYHVFLVAHNRVGNSEPSDMVTTATSGSEPEIPDRNTVLEVNATAISLRLSSWPNGGCAISHFGVEYKEKLQPEWTVLQNKMTLTQDAVISDLVPGGIYSLRLSAVNSAGTKTVDFDVLTRFTQTGNAMDDVSINSSDYTSHGFYMDLNILMPVIAAFIVVFSILVAVCFFIRRRRYQGQQYSDQNMCKPQVQTAMQDDDDTQKGTINTDNQSYGQAFTPSSSRNPYQLDKEISSDPSQKATHDDISPYATFQLPPLHYEDLSDVRFHTFGYDGCILEEAQNSKQYSKIKKRSEPSVGHASNARSNGKNVRNEGMAPNTHTRSSSKEHINPLRNSTANTCNEYNPEKYYQPQDLNIMPSAPPAEFDSAATDSDTPDIAPSQPRKGHKCLNYVPDILDHRPDSATSTETSPEADKCSLQHYDNRIVGEKLPQMRWVAVRTGAFSVERSPSLENSMEETTFIFHSKTKPPPIFMDSNSLLDTERSTGNNTINDSNPKSPGSLAAAEEELIALLKTGRTSTGHQGQ